MRLRVDWFQGGVSREYDVHIYSEISAGGGGAFRQNQKAERWNGPETISRNKQELTYNIHPHT